MEGGTALREPVPPVSRVRFRLLDDETLSELGGGFEVTDTALEKSKQPTPHGLYSSRLGTDSRARCGVCRLPPEQCAGHVGTIPFARGTCVFHPWFLRQLTKTLRVVCYWCAARVGADAKECPHCGGALPTLSLIHI